MEYEPWVCYAGQRTRHGVRPVGFMGFSFRRIRDLLIQTDDTPQIKAMSVGVGIFIAFSPFVGVHLPISALLIRFTRLNPLLLLASTLVHNPWTLMPIHLLGLVTGDIMLYGHLRSVDQFRAFPWNELGLRTVIDPDFWMAQSDFFMAVGKPFFFGSLVSALVCAIICYYISLKTMTHLNLSRCRKSPHVS